MTCRGRGGGSVAIEGRIGAEALLLRGGEIGLMVGTVDGAALAIGFGSWAVSGVGVGCVSLRIAAREEGQ